MVFLARDKENVGIAPADFFSIGHIIMGQVTFVFFFLLKNVGNAILGFTNPYSIARIWCFLLTLGVGAGWEVVENTLLFKLGLKFNRKDSLANSIWDIIFVTLGGIIAWIFSWWANLLLVMIGLLVFYRGYKAIGTPRGFPRLDQKKQEKTEVMA